MRRSHIFLWCTWVGDDGSVREYDVSKSLDLFGNTRIPTIVQSRSNAITYNGTLLVVVVVVIRNTNSMDITQDYDQAHATSNVDDWLARFSPVAGPKPGGFPFTSHKAQSIESRRARMSDLLIFDVLLIRGGIRSPDMLFPPADWASLTKLLDAIDETIYDILKKDCLVYILLKWAWDMDPKETNPGWDVRYLQDRCIAPQFAALADAYWLLDTGTHLPVRPTFRFFILQFSD